MLLKWFFGVFFFLNNNESRIISLKWLIKKDKKHATIVCVCEYLSVWTCEYACESVCELVCVCVCFGMCICVLAWKRVSVYVSVSYVCECVSV